MCGEDQPRARRFCRLQNRLDLDSDSAWQSIRAECATCTNALVFAEDGFEQFAATIDDNGLVQNNNTLKPDISLYSSGETSAFRLQLIDQDEPERNQWISSDVLGRFNVEQAGANDSSE